MSPITAIAAAALGKKALERVVDDAYSAATGELRKRFKSWKTKKSIKTLYLRVANVRKVKTIWQVDKAVDLISFYHPSKVLIDEKPREVSDVSDFGQDGNVVITGTVGQGKSIFLRYLCAQELMQGACIPLFLELRHLSSKRRLQPALLKCCAALGLAVDSEVFDFLASRGLVHLFLDGFDEVEEKARQRLVADIETLSQRYPSLRMIITSRPGAGVENSPSFHVFRLSGIKPPEVPAVIYKLMGNTKRLSRNNVNYWSLGRMV